MSKISTYNLADTPLQLSDRLIGTEAPRPTPTATPLATKNFSLGELLQLFSSNFPAASLQAVLDTNNTAIEDINLTGTINTTLIKPGNIIDMLNSQGTPLQILSKGVGGICWIDGPNLSGYVPTSRELTINGVTYDLSANRSWTIGTGIQNLQEVTDEGNETTNPLIVISNNGFDENIAYIGPTFIEVSNKDIALNETTRVTLENSGIRRYNIVDGGYMLDLTDASNAVPSTETRLLKAPILAVDEIIATETYVDNGLNSKQDTITLTTIGSGAATFVSNVLNIPTPPVATFLSLTTTGSSGASTLIGGVLNVPTYTLSGLGGQPLSTNLTSLSGLTYVSDSFVKMTAAGTFALDTNTYLTTAVTSVAALTLGTTGTDLSSTVANGTTTPVITLNVPTASATNRGALSSTDWTTFNNKQNSLGYIPLPTTAGTATGAILSFITDRVYGTIASPITGNITADVTGAQLGVTNIIIHNSGTAPTFSSEFKKLSGSGNYVVSVVNYIYCTFITSTEIIYSINQRT